MENKEYGIKNGSENRVDTYFIYAISKEKLKNKRRIDLRRKLLISNVVTKCRIDTLNARRDWWKFLEM